MDKNRIFERGLVAVGLAACVLGAGLAVAKHLHPLAGEYAAGVGRALANGGILAVAGLGFAALGWSRRTHGEESRDLVLEQVAADLVQLRARLDALSTEARDAGKTSKSEDDRLFRLAAAIDQSGARLDARLVAQHDALVAALERLRGGAPATVAPLGGAQESSRSTPEEADDPWLATPEPEIELQTGYEPDEDDIEVVVELEDEDDDGPGLGILDDIEEARGAGAAIPPPLSAPPEASLETKLAALKDLMGDPAVRAALEASRRAG
jgi:hypothetical protein